MALEHSKRVSHFSPKTFWFCMLLVVVTFTTLTITKPAQAVEGIVHDCGLINPTTFSCMPPNTPEFERVTMTRNDGSVYVKTRSTSIVAYCSGGLCSNGSNSEYVGRSHPTDTYRAIIPNDFYLHTDPVAKIVKAWRVGYGPEFNNNGVVVESVTYDLSCGLRPSDSCLLGDKELYKEELVNHIPMANVDKEIGPSWSCDQESCVRNSDDKVIGLNPFYYQ